MKNDAENEAGLLYTEGMKLDPPLFLVDENLRGLTRWLRFLGLNTVTAMGVSDKMIEARAKAEGRVLLTRDRELATALGPERALLLKSQRTPDQLRELFSRYSWPEERHWFSRCTICNRELRELGKEENQAPPEYDRAWICEECGRVYWRGAHYHRTRAYFDRVRSR